MSTTAKEPTPQEIAKQKEAAAAKYEADVQERVRVILERSTHRARARFEAGQLELPEDATEAQVDAAVAKAALADIAQTKARFAASDNQFKRDIAAKIPVHAHRPSPLPLSTDEE